MDNYARLKSIKQTYDPEGMFRVWNGIGGLRPESSSVQSQLLNDGDDALKKCIEAAPLDDNTKNEDALRECAKEAGYDDKNSCALKCTLEAIGVFWAAAGRCIEKQAPNSCITVECPAIVAAFDIPCLKSCHNQDQY